MMVMGHGGNTVTRIPEAIEAMNKLELLVVADPHPTTFAALNARQNDTYLLPVATSLEMDGSRTASNRSLQWGEKIVEPIFESKTDYEIMFRLANRLGFGEAMFKNIKIEMACRRLKTSAGDQSRRLVHRLLRPEPRAPQGAYEASGQFDLVTMRAPKDTPEVAAITTDCRGLVGASPSCVIPAATFSTIPTFTSWTAAARSARGSALSETAKHCWPRTHSRAAPI